MNGKSYIHTNAIFFHCLAHITVFENHTKKSHSTLRAKRATLLCLKKRRKSLIFRAEKVLEKCQNDQFGELSERLKLGVKSTVFENHTKKSHLTLRAKRATFTY